MSRYRTDGQILGQGAFGVVYKGIRVGTDLPVAIKVINIRSSTQHNFPKSQIEKEIITIKELSSEPNCHPNILCFLDSYEEVINGEPSILIVTELIKGVELFQYLKQSKNWIQPELLWKWMMQLVSAVDYIHYHGYAHRDIKLQNIMIDENNNLKLVDFGLACNNGCRNNGGTKPYLPPEFFSVEKPDESIFRPNRSNSLKDSQAHDIWSMGITLYFLANFKLPFVGQATYAKLNYLNQSNYQLNTADGKITSAMFNFLIMQMLTVDVKQRDNADTFKKYMIEETNACTSNDRLVTRIQLLQHLENIGQFPDSPFHSMSELCQLTKFTIGTPMPQNQITNLNNRYLVPKYNQLFTKKSDFGEPNGDYSMDDLSTLVDATTVVDNYGGTIIV